jgi:hypothetical protein
MTLSAATGGDPIDVAAASVVELGAAALVLSDVVDRLSVFALGGAGGARLIGVLAEELREAVVSESSVA